MGEYYNSRAILKLIREFCRRIFKVFLALLFLLLAIPFIPTFLLLFILRQIVKYLAKIIRPDLSEMVTCTGNACANVDSNVQNPRFAVLTKFTFSDKLDVEELIEVAKSQVFYLKDRNGELMYPEMNQYLTSWLGYRFWKQDKDFDFYNHSQVVDLGTKSVNQDQLRDFGEQLLVKPFHPKRSPWDLHLVHNVSVQKGGSENESNMTAFYFRFSHVLGDGYAFLKFFLNFFEIDEENETPIKTKYPKGSIFQNLLFPLKFLYVHATICCNSLTRFPFKVPEDKKSHAYHLQLSDRIPAAVIKELKNELGIGFTSAVIGIVSGVIRSMILKTAIPVPHSFPSSLPFPKPNHPSKLRNHFTLASIDLPVGEPDPLIRMKKCHKKYECLKSSVFPIATDVSMKLTGVCFTSLGTLIGQNHFGVVNTSYIPFPYKRIRIRHHHLIDFSFGMGTQKGSTALSVSICSFNDGLVFTFAADKGIMSKDDALAFKDILNQEIENLKKISIPAVV